MAVKKQMVFDEASTRVLSECLAIGRQRGGEYADSWTLENIVTTLTRATLARFGVNLDAKQLRLLLLSALADVKDSRIASGGAWKLDSSIDGLNYRSAYAALRDDYEKEQQGDAQEESAA